MKSSPAGTQVATRREYREKGVWSAPLTSPSSPAPPVPARPRWYPRSVGACFDLGYHGSHD